MSMNNEQQLVSSRLEHQTSHFRWFDLFRHLFVRISNEVINTGLFFSFICFHGDYLAPHHILIINKSLGKKRIYICAHCTLHIFWFNDKKRKKINWSEMDSLWVLFSRSNIKDRQTSNRILTNTYNYYYHFTIGHLFASYSSCSLMNYGSIYWMKSIISDDNNTYVYFDRYIGLWMYTVCRHYVIFRNSALTNQHFSAAHTQSEIENSFQSGDDIIVWNFLCLVHSSNSTGRHPIAVQIKK